MIISTYISTKQIPIIISTCIFTIWISTVISTCISTIWIFTVISTCISIKYACIHIYTDVSMECSSTVSLRRYLYYHNIQVKPEIRYYQYSYLYKDIATVTPIHIKPEISKSWIPSRSLLQPYMKHFHKFIAYYIFDYNHYDDTDNIRRQVVGYTMSLKKKRRTKLKAHSPE